MDLRSPREVTAFNKQNAAHDLSASDFHKYLHDDVAEAEQQLSDMYSTQAERGSVAQLEDADASAEAMVIKIARTPSFGNLSDAGAEQPALDVQSAQGAAPAGHH